MHKDAAMPRVILPDPIGRPVTDGELLVVVASADEVAGWQETVHLFRSPANAERVLASVKQARDALAH